jgi:hypothetical protein
MPPFLFHRPTGPTDPHRSLGLAIRTGRQLGVLSVLIGLFIVIVPGLLNPLRFKWYFLGGGVLFFLAPGITYLLALRPLRDKRMGALIAAASAAGVQFLAACGLLILQMTLRPVSSVPVALALVWAMSTLYLLFHLRDAFNAIRYDATDRTQGFEVTLSSPPASQSQKQP